MNVGRLSCIRPKVDFTADLRFMLKNFEAEHELNGLYPVTHIIKSIQVCITLTPSICISKGLETLVRSRTCKIIVCPYLVCNTVP